MWVICCRKKKKKGASLSVNLQIKPFSITPPHLICSQTERVTFLLPCAHRDPGATGAAFRDVGNLINILFTICERVRSISHCRSEKGSPRCGNITLGDLLQTREQSSVNRFLLGQNMI